MQQAQHVPAPMREDTDANVAVFAIPRGRLTARDLNRSLPNSAELSAIPQATEPPHTGRTFKAAAHPCALCQQGRVNCQCDIRPGSFDAFGASVMAALTTGRAVAIGFAVLFVVVLGSHLFSGGGA